VEILYKAIKFLLDIHLVCLHVKSIYKLSRMNLLIKLNEFSHQTYHHFNLCSSNEKRIASLQKKWILTRSQPDDNRKSKKSNFTIEFSRVEKRYDLSKKIRVSTRKFSKQLNCRIPTTIVFFLIDQSKI